MSSGTTGSIKSSFGGGLKDRSRPGYRHLIGAGIPVRHPVVSWSSLLSGLSSCFEPPVPLLLIQSDPLRHVPFDIFFGVLTPEHPVVLERDIFQRDAHDLKEPFGRWVFIQEFLVGHHPDVVGDPADLQGI